jgi:hypothetical protein
MVRLSGTGTKIGLIGAASATCAIAAFVSFGATGETKEFARDFVMPTKSLVSNAPRQPGPGETWVTSAPKFGCESAGDVHELSSIARDEKSFQLALATKLFLGRCARIQSGTTVHVVTRDQSGLVCLSTSESGLCETTTPLDLSPLPL